MVVSKSNKKKIPLTERTETRGLVKVKIPWFGGHFEFEFPGTNRSVMIVICAMFCMLTLIIPLCCYIVFVGAVPENISRFSQMVRRSAEGKPDNYREPEQVQVKTDSGIEIIEVCPPCALGDCEEDCPCPLCPPCPVQVPCTSTKTEPVLRDTGKQ